MHQQAEREAMDRQQIAVTKAIASIFPSENKPAYASLLFQPFGGDLQQPTGKPFPYDVHFLDKVSLHNIVKLTTDHGHIAWPQDRLDAYSGVHILAKRAAVTAFLWARYIDDPAMTLEKLKLWHEVEVLDQLLKVPTTFRVQHIGQDVTALWKAQLGRLWGEYAVRHQTALGKLLEV